MGDPSSPPSPPPAAAETGGGRKTVADLDADVLAQCAGFLGLRDVVNLSMACKPLHRLASSDSVWDRLFRERWPHLLLSCGASGAREQYLARHTALHQLKFADPFQIFIARHASPCGHLLLDKNYIVSAQGSLLQRLSIDSLGVSESYLGHTARVTCVRLFPITETSLFRNAMYHEENVIVTSSADRTIRLWWKGRSQRCFKGHNGPVTSLADKLLGQSGSKVLASGGEDCTVRIWSFNSSMKHRQLMATYYGHEKPLSFLAVSGHRDYLLASISKDSRVKVWDICASSSSSSSSCVGMTSVGTPPVAMKCHDTLCYIASGSLVTAIDLRTMQKALPAVLHVPQIHSFEMLPSKWLLCTGGKDKALLWDIRKIEKTPVPVADLESNNNVVTLLHMDPYKIVTGGAFDHRVKVWETGTGLLANPLNCCVHDVAEHVAGPTAMAVDGCRIVTACCSEEPGIIYYRDFANCSVPVSIPDSDSGSKFWEPQHLSDGDDDKQQLQ